MGLDPDPDKNPDHFNPNKIKHIKIEQVAWWDEHHIECVIAVLGGNGLQVRFPRNADGTLNPEGGTLSKLIRKTLNVKYKKQGRYCLGVAKVSISGETSGRRAKPFYYSGRKVISIKAWDALILAELKRVKSMDANSFWCGNKDPVDDSIYPSSPLCKLPQIAPGGTTEKTLIEAGFKKVSDIMMMTDDIKKKLKSLKGIGTGKIDAWIKKLEEIKAEPSVQVAVPVALAASVEVVAPVEESSPVEGAIPGVVAIPVDVALPVQEGAQAGGNASVVRDHRTQTNPYYSKWGPVEGEKRLRNSTAMNKYCCIKELVTHIVEESETLFKGTDHEGNWYFFHDALTTMTSAETVAWMRSKDYLKYWILPQHDLLINTRYHNKLPGDSPELMPMDSTLNKDIDDSAKRHVAVTSHLEWSKNCKDQRKFSLATPIEGMLLYIYTWL